MRAYICLFLAASLSACASAPTPSIPIAPISPPVSANPIPNPIPTQTDTAYISPDTSKATKKVKPVLSPAFMQFEKNLLAFEPIRAGEIFEREFIFTNTGDKPLEISKVEGSCGCTVGSYSFLPIAKGEQSKIGVRFDSKGKIGKQKTSLTVYSNAQNSPQVLNLEGVVLDK